jgi:hypothetical protein
MGKIFINYRRDDSIGTAGRLHDRLAQSFGRDQLFMDVDHIPAGVDFVEHLRSQVAQCDVFLAIIGPNWLQAKNEQGRRRLEDPEDFVAVEIASALARDIRVIPVLVDGARIPRADKLPDTIKLLVRRNGVELRNAQFGRDTETLIERVREALGLQADRGEATARGHELLDGKTVGQGQRRFELPSRQGMVTAAVAAGAVLLTIGWLGGWLSAPRSIGAPPVVPANETIKGASEQQQVAIQAREPAPVVQDCIPGYVWREAYPNDRVCVTPEMHSRTLEDNRLAGSRRAASSGAYGPDTCKAGFVWREAGPNDRVCVTPETRAQVRYQNSSAPQRSTSAPISASDRKSVE